MKNEDEMRKKLQNLKRSFGMLQAFGCTHIPILRPTENSQDYFCYKMFFSLNVQAVCDAKGLDCFWMWTDAGQEACMMPKV